jgi:hypothetical protein
MQANGFGKGHIGHNLAGWSCAINGQRFSGISGVSGEDSGQLKTLVKRG